MTTGDERRPLQDALRQGHLGDALRLSRRAQGWSLDNLVARLRRRDVHVSRSALNAWERGEYRPGRRDSLDVLAALEDEYGYPTGTLTRLAADEDGGAASTPGAVPTDRLPEAYFRLVERVGYQTSHDSVAIHEFHWIDENGLPSRHRTRQVVRATQAGHDRHLFVFDPRGEALPAPLEGLQNCRPSRRWQDETTGLSAVELLFDRTLDRGETHVFEYETRLRYRTPPPAEFRRHLPPGLQHLVVHVTFHPQRRPARVVWCEWPTYDAQARDGFPLVVSDTGSAHHVLTDPRPGRTVGMRWEW